MPRIAPLAPADASGGPEDSTRFRPRWAPRPTRPLVGPRRLIGLSQTRRGSIGAANGERIALAVAEHNECAYCPPAHWAPSSPSWTEVRSEAARHFESSDPKAAAILAFARAVVRETGGISVPRSRRALRPQRRRLSDIVGHVAVTCSPTRSTAHSRPRSTSRSWSRTSTPASEYLMHVAELWRYPVKSMAGEPLDEAPIGVDGVPGDRSLYAYDGREILVLALLRRPRLLGHRAAIGEDGDVLVDGEPWQKADGGCGARGGGTRRAAGGRALRHPPAARHDRRRDPGVRPRRASGRGGPSWHRRGRRPRGARLGVEPPRRGRRGHRPRRSARVLHHDHVASGHARPGRRRPGANARFGGRFALRLAGRAEDVSA